MKISPLAIAAAAAAVYVIGRKAADDIDKRPPVLFGVYGALPAPPTDDTGALPPLQQFQRCHGHAETAALDDYVKPERLGPILGSVGGLLMLVNAKDPLLRVAAGVLTVGSLYYGIATRPPTEST